MKIAVIGVGTAGITSISHLLGWLPKEAEITSIYDPSIKILGIGESSTPGLPLNLFKGANFTILEDADELDATIKLGATYKNWRGNEFKAAMEPPSYAIHFNNFKIKEFCFKRFNEIWGAKFKIVEGRVNQLQNVGHAAIVTVDNIDHIFDFVIDCRGFPEDFSEYKILENMPVNHCLVNMIPESGNWNTTINQATKNGWMFGIPLKTRQGWGYLYNDKITSREEAVADIEEIFGKTNLDLREFSFKNYHARQFFDGRILKNGNTALFFEPIEATSGFFYETIMRYFVDYIYGGFSIEQMNSDLLSAAQDIEMFIHYVYHGGSNFNTKFWETTTKNSSEKLANNKRWQATIAEVKKCHDNGVVLDNKIVSRWLIKHWVEWDKMLGYNYFNIK
jgi:hypothetical protein